MAEETGTELVHLTYDGNFQLETNATVLACRVVEGAAPGDQVRVEVELSATTLHPQGGGQPTDTGTISLREDDVDGGDGGGDASSSPAIAATIDRVTLDRATGVVTHAGRAAAPLPVGAAVRVRVDAARRRVLAECHTAGHLVDAAVARSDAPLPATKGYHFLEGPYVEFQGAIAASEREGFLARLQAAYRELIDQDLAIGIRTLPVDEADALCNRVAQNFNFDDYTSSENPNPTVRVVTVADGAVHAVPCGGTHVRSTGELKERGWAVRGLKCKKGVVRVKYGPEECKIAK